MNNSAKVKSEETTPRVIGPVAGFAVVAGSMLGVGIFLFPSAVALETGSVALFFMVWVLGGFFALSGSVACGELGAMMPRAGGDYVFQREAFGPSVAFAGGWVLFVAIFGGSIAGMSVAVFQYQIAALTGLDLLVFVSDSIPIPRAHLLAILLILALTIINDAGTRVSARTQILFTLIPILLLIILGSYVLFFSPEPVMEAISVYEQSSRTFSFSGIVTAFLLVNFAYSGWLNIIYVAGEVKNPGRNIPRSMILATVAVTLLYCLMCAAFIASMGFDGLAYLGNVDAGTGMALALKSPLVANIVVVTIAIAIITSLNATVLTSSRVAYAMAKDGAFWKGAAVLSRKHKVPRRALWIQALLASVFVLTGSFYAIIEMASLAMFLTGSLTVLSLFVLRWKNPKAIRPYRATGYPLLPIVYLLISFVVIVATAREVLLFRGNSDVYSSIGVVVLVLMFTGHWVYRRYFR